MSDAVSTGDGAAPASDVAVEAPAAVAPAPVEVPVAPVEISPEPVVVETMSDAAEVPEIEPVVSEIEVEAAESPQASPPPSPADAPYDEGFSANDVLAPASTPAPAPAAAPVSSVRSILAKGLESIRFRKRGKLEKIITLAREKGSITNDDVQLAVLVSHATATRYLSELVLAGRLKRSGPSEHAVYEPV